MAIVREQAAFGSAKARATGGVQGLAKGLVGLSWVKVPLLIFLVTRLGLLAVAYGGIILLPANYEAGVWGALTRSLLLDGWVRWDAGSHLIVAESGYVVLHDGGHLASTSLPAYGMLVGVFAAVLGDLVTGALVVSNGAFAIALVLCYWLVRRKLGEAMAARSTLLLCLSPFAFLYSAAYAESLALAFSLGAFCLGERGRFWPASVFASFAALTTPSGIVVWPAVAAARLVAPTSRRRDLLAVVVPVALVGAFVAYLRLVQAPTSDIAATILGVDRIVAPAETLDALKTVGTAGTSYGLLAVLDLVVGAVALLAVWPAWRALGPGYGLLVAFLVARSIAIGPDSLGQDVLLAFPAAVAIGRRLQGQLWESLVVSVAAVPLALLCVSFVDWYPVNWTSTSPALSAEATILTRWEALLARVAPQGDLRLRTPEATLILGYSVDARRVVPGQRLGVTVYLDPPSQSDRVYLVSAHLVDDEGHRWASAERELGGEKSLGVPKVASSYALALSIEVGEQVPSGVYDVELLVHDIPTYEMVRLTDWRTGQEREASLGRVAVLHREDVVDVTSAGQLPNGLSVRLGDGVALRGYSLGDGVASPGADLTASLYWESLARMSQNYTVFVQLLSSDGKLVSQSDEFPLAGRYATSDWEPGIILRDSHVLHLPGDMPAGKYCAIAGMYQLETMERLPVESTQPERGPGDGSDYVALGCVEVR